MTLAYIIYSPVGLIPSVNNCSLARNAPLNPFYKFPNPKYHPVCVLDEKIITLESTHSYVKHSHNASAGIETMPCIWQSKDLPDKETKVSAKMKGPAWFSGCCLGLERSGFGSMWVALSKLQCFSFGFSTYKGNIFMSHLAGLLWH